MFGIAAIYYKHLLLHALMDKPAISKKIVFSNFEKIMFVGAIFVRVRRIFYARIFHETNIIHVRATKKFF